MENELLTETSWWKKNRKWLIPVITFVLAGILALYINLSGVLSDYTTVYADPSIYENAVVKANANIRVTETLGKLESVDQLAVMEGYAEYSEDGKKAKITVKVKGTKGRGKLDIVAQKNGAIWDYESIAIRIKEPKETIKIQ